MPQEEPTQGLAQSLLPHPLLVGLFANAHKPRSATRQPGALTQGRTLPSYIPARSFALALRDSTARAPAVGARAVPALASTAAQLRANSGSVGREYLKLGQLRQVSSEDDTPQFGLRLLMQRLVYKTRLCRQASVLCVFTQAGAWKAGNAFSYHCPPQRPFKGVLRDCGYKPS